MCSGKDGYVGTEHAPIADGDETAVEDCQIEVGVETFTKRDVATVVYVERGFDDWRAVSNMLN